MLPMQQMKLYLDGKSDATFKCLCFGTVQLNMFTQVTLVWANNDTDDCPKYKELLVVAGFSEWAI